MMMHKKERKKGQLGGARPGAGRPPGTDNDGLLRVRAPTRVLKKLQQLAERDEIAFPDWIRAALARLADDNSQQV